MEFRYSTEQDILRIRWSDAAIEESNEQQPEVILDYDSSSNVVGIEILNASRKIPQWQAQALASAYTNKNS